VGEDVILNCHLKPPKDIRSLKYVQWDFNDENNIVVYRSGGFSEVLGDLFRGRVSHDNWDLNKGKLPLKISAVQKSDAGSYTCRVGIKEKQINCNIELTITDGNSCLHCYICKQMQY